MQRELTNEGITWHFVPGRSPMQSGNWEIQLRSLKRLLYRSPRSSVFTYEDLDTLLTMIEASLNSQPLCALGSDIGNMEALTPGHFRNDWINLEQLKRLKIEQICCYLYCS